MSSYDYCPLKTVTESSIHYFEQNPTKVSTSLIPCNWPGTQDVDPLYHTQQTCFHHALQNDPLLNVWSPTAQQCRQSITNKLYKLGKNPCQRKTFKKTPVYWFS